MDFGFGSVYLLDEADIVGWEIGAGRGEGVERGRGGMAFGLEFSEDERVEQRQSVLLHGCSGKGGSE